jgi:glyoxylase-like metal-dependent hydrolase (beta-lactamase superfamily II)
MDELEPGLWRWTRRHPDWHPAGFGDEVVSYALRDDVGTVLVDPLLDGPQDPKLETLVADVWGEVRILITIPYHVRSAELIWTHLRERYDVAIYGHWRCRRRLHDASGFREVKGGETLAGGVRAHAVGNPRRMEVPFEIPSHRALAFGDLVVETGGGELRVWKQWETADPWYQETFLPTIRPLAELDVERVLVTHGQPVLHDGAAALAAAFERPAWSRSEA